MGHLQKSFLYSLQHGNLKFKRPLLALILCLLGEMQQFEFWNWRLLKFGHYRSLIWKRWKPPGFWVLGVVLLFKKACWKKQRFSLLFFVRSLALYFIDFSKVISWCVLHTNCSNLKSLRWFWNAPTKTQFLNTPSFTF